MTSLYFKLALPAEIFQVTGAAAKSIPGWGQDTRVELAARCPTLNLDAMQVLYNQEFEAWGLVVVRGRASGRLQAYLYPAGTVPSAT